MNLTHSLSGDTATNRAKNRVEEIRKEIAESRKARREASMRNVANNDEIDDDVEEMSPKDNTDVEAVQEVKEYQGAMIVD